ncbi:acyl-CoA N-acyltransferase [Fennellomyces sp. T-0311]|nr:acyl-CoA N-acyltransferase [Fennellomyces sp. T-0311]
MVTNSIYVRPARLEDLKHTDQVVKVVNAAYNSGDGWTTTKHIVEGARTSPKDIESLVRQNMLLYAFDGDTVIGTIKAAPVVNEESEISILSVLPEYQSKGVGRRLMYAVFDHMRSMGATKATLTSFDNRPEIVGWYSKLGFVQVGDKIPFTYPGVELKISSVCLVVMKKAL